MRLQEKTKNFFAKVSCVSEMKIVKYSVATSKLTF